LPLASKAGIGGSGRPTPTFATKVAMQCAGTMTPVNLDFDPLDRKNPMVGAAYARLPSPDGIEVPGHRA